MENIRKRSFEITRKLSTFTLINSVSHNANGSDFYCENFGERQLQYHTLMLVKNSFTANKLLVAERINSPNSNICHAYINMLTYSDEGDVEFIPGLLYTIHEEPETTIYSNTVGEESQPEQRAETQFRPEPSVEAQCQPDQMVRIIKPNSPCIINYIISHRQKLLFFVTTTAKELTKTYFDEEVFNAGMERNWKKRKRKMAFITSPMQIKR